MSKQYYKILMQEFQNNQLIDNWYLRDTVDDAGYIIFEDYSEACFLARKETSVLNIENKDYIKATVVLVKRKIAYEP